MPMTPKQSPRFAVIATSITGPSTRITSLAGRPTGASGASSMIPVWSSPSISSRAEQSMPALSTPRILARFRTWPVPGMTTPGAANTPFMPRWTFGAPQTTSATSLPVSTRQRLRRSALGCGRTSVTRATLNGDRSAPRVSIPSTSRPSMVSRATICSRVASVSRCSFSQGSVNFIATGRHAWSGRRAPRSRSGAASGDRPRRRSEDRGCRTSASRRGRCPCRRRTPARSRGRR